MFRAEPGAIPADGSRWAHYLTPASALCVSWLEAIHLGPVPIRYALAGPCSSVPELLVVASLQSLHAMHCTPRCNALHAMQARWGRCNAATMQRLQPVPEVKQRSKPVEGARCPLPRYVSEQTKPLHRVLERCPSPRRWQALCVSRRHAIHAGAGPDQRDFLEGASGLVVCQVPVAVAKWRTRFRWVVTRYRATTC
jgi:hypothetical protein